MCKASRLTSARRRSLYRPQRYKFMISTFTKYLGAMSSIPVIIARHYSSYRPGVVERAIEALLAPKTNFQIS